MDDMIIFGPNKRKLHKMRASIDQYLADNLGLELKGNWQVFPIKARALDFMGYRFYRDKVTLRRSILYKACRKAKRMSKKKPSVYEIKQVMSYLGWFSQTDTYYVFEARFVAYINIQNLKRRISRYDKRLAKLPGRLQT